MLEAMSSGGRIGHDAPYMPRGCDMRWFSTEEICEILSRFEKVIIFGDSMMRHVIGSINVLLRKDLGYGAVTDWNFSPDERYVKFGSTLSPLKADNEMLDSRDCFCNYQFNVKACSIQGIFKTADVVINDPDSFACAAGTVDVAIEQMIRFPIAEEELSRLRALIPPTKPKKPFAFIFGHGLWNDLDLQATLDWLDLILETSLSAGPWLAPSSSPSKQHQSSDTKGGPESSPQRHRARCPSISKSPQSSILWPRLFMTPNAAGKEKPDEWLVTQGNKALQIFEEAVREQVSRRGVEHVGTWNMSVQSNKFDGVHVDLKGNLIKAMFVLNWLNMLEIEEF